MEGGEFMKRFEPKTEEDRKREKNREKTLGDMNLYIADAYAFKFNKNLRSTAFAKAIYLPFVEQILANNWEKGIALKLPEEPTYEDTLEHIQTVSTKEEIKLFNDFVDYNWKDALLYPDPNKLEDEWFKIFERSNQILSDKYKNDLYYAVKKIYNVSNQLNMTKQQEKSLNHFSDLIWAQSIFDFNNDLKERRVRIWWSVVCIVWGIVVTIGSAGLGSPAWVTMIVAWLASVGAAYGMSHAEWRVYSNSEYLIEWLAWVIPIWIAWKFAKLRHVHGISKAYQVSNKMARTLLMRETGWYLSTGVVTDIARAWASEYEFSLQYSLLSNLGFALMPLWFSAMAGRLPSLKNVPRNLLWASDEFAHEVQAEVDRIRRYRLTGNNKKADRLIKRLNDKMSLAKAKYEKDLSEAIFETKWKLQSVGEQKDRLVWKWWNLSDSDATLLAKLQSQYDDLFDHMKTLDTLKANLHRTIDASMSKSIRGQLAYEMDDAIEQGKSIKVW